MFDTSLKFSWEEFSTWLVGALALGFCLGGGVVSGFILYYWKRGN